MSIAFIAFFDVAFEFPFLLVAFAWTGRARERKATRALIPHRVRTMR